MELILHGWTNHPMHEERSFVPLLIVILLAFLVPVALRRVKRLRLPVVVGEILAGIAVGRSGLGWVPEHDPTLELLAEFGFVYLMFLSGMEIDFSGLSRASGGQAGPRRLGPRQSGNWGPLPLGTAMFGLTVALSTAAGFGFVYAGLARSPWMMALVLSTTSLGVVVPVLKEQGITGSRYGQTVLLAALIADFCTMLLITVVVATFSRGLTADVLLIAFLLVAFFVVYRSGFLLGKVPRVGHMMEELSHATVQIKVRAAFTIMLVFVVLAQRLGTEVILGAFLAGAAIALLRTPSDTELGHRLEAMGFGFFIPIFFVVVGVQFNLSALTQQPGAGLLVPALIAVGALVKLVPALVFRLSFSWRETFAAGALLSARLSLIIAAAAIGVRVGVLDEAVSSAVILVAIVSVTIGPIVFNRLMAAKEAPRAHPVIVVGANKLGLHVAERLRRQRQDVVLIDSNERRIERARAHGLAAVQADATLPDHRLDAYLEQARALICTYSDPERAYAVCRQARTTYGIESVVAYVAHPADADRFEHLGVRTGNPALDQPTLLALQATNPVAFMLLSRTDDDKEVREVVVNPGSLEGKSLRQLELPGDVLVLAVRRHSGVLIPDGNTRLASGDHLTLVGSVDSLETAEALFEGAAEELLVARK